MKKSSTRRQDDFAARTDAAAKSAASGSVSANAPGTSQPVDQTQNGIGYDVVPPHARPLLPWSHLRAGWPMPMPDPFLFPGWGGVGSNAGTRLAEPQGLEI